jgi:hypothetical protein
MKPLRPLLIALLLLATLAAPALASTFWVLTEGAPLRDGQSGEAQVLAMLPRGEQVQVLESGGAAGPWLRVRDSHGYEGFMYQGHLSATPPPPALSSLFEPLEKSRIMADMADSARSSRSTGPDKPGRDDTLWALVDMRLTRAQLSEFLKEGGIGEYASTQPFLRGGAPVFPALAPAAPYGGDAERRVGLGLAELVARRMAKPAFGMALQRYVNLVGLAVARYAPGPVPPFRVVVLESPAIAAFHLPGGVVMLTTGLMAALENEAQLALVLAHEIAHASLGHGWAHARGAQFFRDGGVPNVEGMRSPLFKAMLEDMLAYTLKQGIEPGLELDADAAAVQMAWRAGYDPQQWPRVLQLLDEADKNAPAPPQGMRSWTALHPPLPRRMEHARPMLARLPQSGLALAAERFHANR